MAVAEKPRSKLTLEDYDCFFHLPEERGFTLDQLQQVLLMHGFIKIKTKVAIVAGMKAVDMMPPTRSTLRVRSTYPCAAISLEEIRADIAVLDWQECPVGSLVTVGPAAGSPPPPASAAAASPVVTAVATASPVAALATAVSATRKNKKKKKWPTAADASPVAASVAAGSPGAALENAGSATSKKRRRKRRASIQLSGDVLN